MKSLGSVLYAAALSLSVIANANGAPVVPVTYSMLNGQKGWCDLPYHDEIYTGAGDRNADFSPLTGGLGELTDGVLGSIAKGADCESTRPWVGWANRDVEVTFDFGVPTHLATAAFHVDNSSLGGKTIFGTLLLSVSMDGTTFRDRTLYVTSPEERANRSVFFVTAPLDEETRFVRAHFGQPQGEWLFLSEAHFDSVVIPEPSAVVLGVGLMLLVVPLTWKARQRRRDATANG